MPQGEQPCIRLLDDFRLGQGRHVCIVMEALDQSLRKVLRTHGRGKGISYKAVRPTAIHSTTHMYLYIYLYFYIFIFTLLRAQLYCALAEKAALTPAMKW